MPFNEALFWFGLTAFGTGLYFLFEATVKRLYSIGVTIIGFLACAYAEYRHYHPEFPAIRLWVILLVLTWALLGYNIYIRRVNPKKPSKLVINWANYRAVEGGGEEFQVGDFLRQMILGDSLVFDIENHNFVIGDKNFVPRDPLWGKEKRLQVNYSYGAQPARTTERREHGRLLLPEDSKIKYLMDEVDRLKAVQPKPSQYPVPQLRANIVAMVSELQGFLGEHGDEPVVTRLTGESTKDTALRYFKEGNPWRAKFIGDYRLRFGDSIPKLRDEMRAKARIDDHGLNDDIEWAANSTDRCYESVNSIAKRLWELGRKINA